jgi:hypothetical protein
MSAYRDRIDPETWAFIAQSESYSATHRSPQAAPLTIGCATSIMQASATTIERGAQFWVCPPTHSLRKFYGETDRSAISRCSCDPVHGCASHTASSSSTPSPGSPDGMTLPLSQRIFLRNSCA